MTRSRSRRLHDPPPRYDRYKLYIPDDQYVPGVSSRTRLDQYGTYVYITTDCGWEWLATRPLVNRTPLGALFDRLHERAHRPSRKRP